LTPGDTVVESKSVAGRRDLTPVAAVLVHREERARHQRPGLEATVDQRTVPAGFDDLLVQVGVRFAASKIAFSARSRKRFRNMKKT